MCQHSEYLAESRPGMNQHSVGSETKGFANAHRVRTIDFARSGIEGTGSLSPRSRRTLAVYIVLVKMGYCGISAPMGAIADAVFRSSHGEAGSIRTLQRANAELEDKGFISPARFRPGKRARGAVIAFRLEAFSFWTKIKTHKVTPLPTHEHISPDATSCRPPDRTRDQVAYNSQNTTKNEHTKQRAGARASQKTSRKRKDPVLYSVDRVLSKSTGLHRADRRAARARAMCEVKAMVAGIALVNPSGVDWEYWAKRWGQFSVAVKESTVSREILPRLISKSDSAEQLDIVGAEQLDIVGAEQLDIVGAEQISKPTENQIRAVREALEKKFSLPTEAHSPSTISESKIDYPEVDENDPEMQLLIRARDRARSRVNNR